MYVIIPFLDSTIAVEQDIVDTSTNSSAVADSKIKIPQLREAKKGWESILARNEQIRTQARQGRLKRVTQLVANALLTDSAGNDNVKYINGEKAPNADALRAISAIGYLLLLLLFQCNSLLTWFL